ncbi:MAG: nucleotidyltransferase domain-containing protein [Bacillota bacterium]
MMEAGKDLRTIIERLTSALLELDPIAIYLFGSQATGETRPDSDIDLAVLLPKGEELTALERLDMIDQLQEIAGCGVDLVVVNAARLPLQFEIIRTGRVLYESSFDARTDVEDIIVRDYLDLQPMYEQNFREISEAAQEEARARHVQ